MKNRNVLIIAGVVSLALFSCGEDAKKTERPLIGELKKMISNYEDTLTAMQAKGKEIKSLNKIELINRYLAIYTYYPELDEAANSLDKVHMIYSGMGAYDQSVCYADTLLDKYPNYVNRELVLESQGSNYDIFIVPRDSAKVRLYYTTLLKEFPKMNQEKKKGIEERLRNNHLSFDQYLNQQLEKEMKKQVVN